MFDLNQLKGVLDHYTGASADQPPQNVHQDFDEAAQNAPKETLVEGISHAFRSDQTPPFQQMISQLFTNGNTQQKAGLLNTLLSATGSSGLPAGSGPLAGLASLLGRGATNVTPEQAQQVSPQAVEQLAQHVHGQNPSIVEEISGFVAQHPGWVKTLGAGALTLALSRMATHHHI
ncbi:MAG TPA: hypothetical protein VFB72_11345 [Verrucomicrobiae bacterium]|nr:hypothetical protein [Verrucomicrobiae bacterium]